MSTAQFNTWKNAAGAKTLYPCLAWCNFDGTLTGTITPRASANIASITKNGTGDFTMTFGLAMVDANYTTALGSTSNGLGNGVIIQVLATVSTAAATLKTASAVRICASTTQATFAYIDMKEMYFSAHGNY